jgi:hypothetical protein
MVYSVIHEASPCAASSDSLSSFHMRTNIFRRLFNFMTKRDRINFHSYLQGYTEIVATELHYFHRIHSQRSPIAGYATAPAFHNRRHYTKERLGL